MVRLCFIDSELYSYLVFCMFFYIDVDVAVKVFKGAITSDGLAEDEIKVRIVLS